MIVAALIARVIIPAGYMPAISAHGKPGFHLMICGGKAMPQDDQKGHKAHEALCPFSVNTAFSLTGTGAPMLALLGLILITVLLPAAFLFPAARRFCNASSRAPPLFS